MHGDFLSGHRIGEYDVERRLRAGGMATLFLARRRGAAGFSRHAAIKVIHPHLSDDPRFVKMFIDEARISARIDHPNVVHVEQLGEENGLYYLAMEYVEGCSVGQLMRALIDRSIRLPIYVAVHIAIEIAHGLHAAHETRDADGVPLGIVHRDISPSNVLLSAAGHVKIIDFGIAKARGRIAGTESKCIKGKLRYMAPEQARGEAIDRRADLYALGVVLWELIAGEKAFEADGDLAQLERIRCMQELQPIRELREDVSEELEAVIAAATSPKLEARPVDAYELARQLGRACPDARHLDHRRFGTLIREVLAHSEGERMPTARARLARASDASALAPVEDVPLLTLAPGDLMTVHDTLPPPRPPEPDWLPTGTPPPTRNARLRRYRTPAITVVLAGSVGLLLAIASSGPRLPSIPAGEAEAFGPRAPVTEAPAPEAPSTTADEPKVRERVLRSRDPEIEVHREVGPEPRPRAAVTRRSPAAPPRRRESRPMPTARSTETPAPTAAPSPPAAEASAAPVVLDGVVIASEDDPGSALIRESRRPVRVGKTSIAEGFDE